MSWTLLGYSAGSWAAAALVVAVIVIVWLITSPVTSEPAQTASDSDGLIDGVRVRVDEDDGWTVTMSAACPSAAELFAHRPMIFFDRPVRALFGPLRRLDAPASYGAGWAFYGAPVQAAREIAGRLPPPGPWTRIELGDGVLEASFSGPGKMSSSRLREEAASFRALLGAVRGR